MRAAISADLRISVDSILVGGIRGGPMIPPGQSASRAALNAVVTDFSWNTWICSCCERRLNQSTDTRDLCGTSHLQERGGGNTFGRIFVLVRELGGVGLRLFVG